MTSQTSWAKRKPVTSRGFRGRCVEYTDHVIPSHQKRHHHPIVSVQYDVLYRAIIDYYHESKWTLRKVCRTHWPLPRPPPAVSSPRHLVSVMISIYQSIYLSMFVCMCLSIYLSVSISMYVCMHACMYVCMYVFMYVRIYLSMNIYIYIYIYIYTYIYIYIYIPLYRAVPQA